LHPDRNKAPDAEARFKEVSEAYAVLSDEQKRSQYDRFGKAGLGAEDVFRGVDFGDIFGGLGGAGFEDIFERFFGASPFGGRARRRGGRDVELPLSLTLEEVAQGAHRRVEVPRRAACKACAGTGAAKGSARSTCTSCRGQGEVRVTRAALGFQFVQVGACPTCQGRGSVVDKPCKACAGEGLVRERAQLELDIPPGVEDGQVLVVQGAGEPGREGLSPGNLYVLLDVQAHPRFERRGRDLATVLLVPFPTAALGGSVELDLLGGKREKVQVREGTQSGSVLVLDGLGFPDARGGRGDLHVLVHVEVPGKLSPKARELLRQLQDEWGSAQPKGSLRDLLRGVWRKGG
jgi:molecular chaperone DnaJ